MAAMIARRIFRPHLEQLEARDRPGVIASMNAPVGPGLGAARVVASATNKPNNDNVGAGNKDNFYSHDVSFGTSGIIDREYVVTNSNGTSEYRFEDVVVNNTGNDLVWFHWELGFGTGANFERRGTPALDMDWPDQDPTPQNFTQNTFRTLSHGQYTIDWSDGLIQDTKSGSFFWNVDVCDWDPLNMPASAQMPNGYKFTLRLIPSPTPIPNPGGGGETRARNSAAVAALLTNPTPEPLATSTPAFATPWLVLDLGSANKTRAPVPAAIPAPFPVGPADKFSRTATAASPSLSLAGMGWRRATPRSRSWLTFCLLPIRFRSRELAKAQSPGTTVSDPSPFGIPSTYCKLWNRATGTRRQ